MRFSVRRRHHLDLVPAESTNAGPEDLCYGLFCREAGGEAVHSAGAERDLLRGERAPEEPVASYANGPLELIEFDSVNACADDARCGPVGWHHVAPGEDTDGA